MLFLIHTPCYNFPVVLKTEGWGHSPRGKQRAPWNMVCPSWRMRYRPESEGPSANTHAEFHVSCSFHLIQIKLPVACLPWAGWCGSPSFPPRCLRSPVGYLAARRRTGPSQPCPPTLWARSWGYQPPATTWWEHGNLDSSTQMKIRNNSISYNKVLSNFMGVQENVWSCILNV